MKKRAGLTYDAVVRLGLALPGVEEGTSYGTPALKVHGATMTRLWEDGQTLVIKTTFEQRDALIAEDPARYYITDHYRGYPWVLLRLPRANADTLSDLLRGAHRLALAETRRPHRKTARKRQ